MAGAHQVTNQVARALSLQLPGAHQVVKVPQVAKALQVERPLGWSGKESSSFDLCLSGMVCMYDGFVMLKTLRKFPSS